MASFKDISISLQQFQIPYMVKVLRLLQKDLDLNKLARDHFSGTLEDWITIASTIIEAILQLCENDNTPNNHPYFVHVLKT